MQSHHTPHPFKDRPFATRFKFALAGLGHTVRSERSFRVQLVCFAVALLALALLRPAPIWWALVIAAGLSVLALELVNTALERLSDHLHPAQHPRIGQVKDCAAAAVLCAALGAVGIAIALAVEILRR